MALLPNMECGQICNVTKYRKLLDADCRILPEMEYHAIKCEMWRNMDYANDDLK